MGGFGALCNTVPSVHSSFACARENRGGGDHKWSRTSQPHPVSSPRAKKNSHSHLARANGGESGGLSPHVSQQLRTWVFTTDEKWKDFVSFPFPLYSLSFPSVYYPLRPSVGFPVHSAKTSLMNPHDNLPTASICLLSCASALRDLRLRCHMLVHILNST